MLLLLKAYMVGTFHEMAGLMTLRAHRIEKCDKFAEKCLGSERFLRWFSEMVGARSSRLRNLRSFPLHMRGSSIHPYIIRADG